MNGNQTHTNEFHRCSTPSSPDEGWRRQKLIPGHDKRASISQASQRRDDPCNTHCLSRESKQQLFSSGGILSERLRRSQEMRSPIELIDSRSPARPRENAQLIVFATGHCKATTTDSCLEGLVE